MIQTYTFSGTGRQIDAQGVFFRYEQGSDGSGVTSIRVLADGAILGTFEPGDTIDLPTPAKRWEIYPTSNGCIGSVRIGNARVTSNKLQGVVQVVDGAKARSIGGVAFAGSAYQTGSAGSFSSIELWNNGVGSKNLIVNDIAVVGGAVSQTPIYFYLVANQLTTLAQPGRPKRVYGADSACGQIRTQLTTQFINPLRLLMAASGSSQSWRMTEPLIIPPSTGLVAQASIGIDVGASFDWWEEPA